MSQTPAHPLRFLVLVVALYASAVALLYGEIGVWAITLAAVPVISIAVAFGRVGGILSALSVIPTNYMLFGLTTSTVFSGYEFWLSQLLLLAVGIFIGISGDTRRELEKEVSRRERTEQTLRTAIEQIKTLHGTMPICSACKHIREDSGDWVAVEHFITQRSDADFTHGICPPCANALYPE